MKSDYEAFCDVYILNRKKEISSHGSIVRKIGVMGSLPATNENLCNPIAVSRDELYSFVEKTALLVVNKLKVKKLI